MSDSSDDPRAAASVTSLLRSEQFWGRDTKVVLVHATKSLSR
jgi:hypothetical protein